MLVSIQTILEEIKKLQDYQEASIQYVQSSYDEQLQNIQETRRKINASLDMIEQKTLNEMKDTLTKLKASSKSDIDKCIGLRNELKQLRDAIQDISDKSKLELSFIANRKCKDKIQQSETFLKENSRQVRVSITFQPNSEIVQYISNQSGLGRIEHRTQTLMVFTGQGKSVLNVTQSNEWFNSNMIAICVLLDGQVLVADWFNKNVRLLDQQYQVVSHCSVTTWPWDMCQVTPSEVAVTVDDHPNTHEVQFITVKNRKLMTGRKLQIQHTIQGIASHQGDLYITSRTSLYKYTMRGKQVSKMYEVNQVVKQVKLIVDYLDMIKNTLIN
ncbi:hypothetical protein DPMN_109898 [Dreissena polymorpha]|uniref:Uncharacterized protein n=2 Tax=Dreissena polymorpha TaxID=45954 RepID=A0A9D4KBE3_DREPO|nr:hypothetical protein DPMN_109898 [Dreissena polymorpha]